MHEGAQESISKREHWKSIVKWEQGQHMQVGAQESISKCGYLYIIIYNKNSYRVSILKLKTIEQPTPSYSSMD
jgi:hypothetical protein